MYRDQTLKVTIEQSYKGIIIVCNHIMDLRKKALRSELSFSWERTRRKHSVSHRCFVVFKDSHPKKPRRRKKNKHCGG